jgi:hypothetical protein
VGWHFGSLGLMFKGSSICVIVINAELAEQSNVAQSTSVDRLAQQRRRHYWAGEKIQDGESESLSINSLCNRLSKIAGHY